MKMKTRTNLKTWLVILAFFVLLPCVTTLGGEKASDPNPPDGGQTDDPSVILSWTPGDNAIMHDVYIGTDEVAVAAADVTNPLGVYRGRQIATNYMPGPLPLGIYYWRIDEVFETDPSILISEGDVWCFGVGVTPGVIYVDADAAAGGDGTSWANAYKHLQDALYKPPSSGDQIWVAAGTYKPDVDEGGNVTLDDRTATFQLISGAALYGGFAGGESSLDERDWQTNQTILSADIGTVSDNSDNCYHVVDASGCGEMTVLDGFTITGGNADGPVWYGVSGGGIYNDGGNLVVGNCTFSGNSAHYYGGGIYNGRPGGSPTAINCTVTNCTFTSNSAGDGGDGGGMWNDSWCIATVAHCTFSDNSARRGGGIMNIGWWGEKTFSDCTFSGNSATLGGGVYNDGADPTLTNCSFDDNWACQGGGMYGICAGETTLINCTFTGNEARGEDCEDLKGGGIYSEWSSSIDASNCTFSGNSATYGGGIYSEDTWGTLNDCTFSGNDGYGGAIYIDRCWHKWELTNCIFSGHSARAFYSESSSPTLDNCTFADNPGGGMRNYDESSPTLTNCTFRDNSASSGGGMVNHLWCDATLTNCTFTGNTATGNSDIYTYDGGGMSNIDSSPTLSDCTFSGNTADDKGGGMYNYWKYCRPTLTNCTFSDNSALQGGGMYNEYESDPKLTNCAFHHNNADSGGGIYNKRACEPTLTNCAFYHNEADSGAGIYNYEYSDPILTNCTFTQNLATIIGGGIYNDDDGCNPTLTNCILWGDTPDEIAGIGISTVTYSDIQGGAGQPWFWTGCIDTDPLLADADGRLSAGSPCINTGSNAAVPAGVTTDLDGIPRILNGTVDMGAYEFHGPPNQPPIADAGDDEIGFAWFDGIAEVTLDGSGSSDPDGDPLTYRWYLDGQIIATGVNPTIELPIGEHVIELIVNDGTQDSEPDEVIVDVFGPVPVDDLVHLTYGYMRFDRRTGLMSMDVRITNTSDRTIISPVGLVIESISDSSVTLASSDGTTHDGKPYIDLSGLLGDGQLVPGESVTTRLYFNNPSRRRFTFEPSVRAIVLP